MSAQSLEAERQAILDRMQARRERYRMMLVSGADLEDDAVAVEPHAAYPPTHSFAPQEHDIASESVPAYRQRFQMEPAARHGPVVRALMEHPFLCALGVAAVVAIGPRRIFRGLARGGTVLSTVAASNQSNLDMVGRLLAMLGAYVQGRTQQ